MRLHVVALPHTLLTRAYDYCAYTGKVRRFANMLTSKGWAVTVYGPDVTELAPAVETVTIVTARDRQQWFGASEWNHTQSFGYWKNTDRCWTVMNDRASQAIRDRWQPGDELCLIAGNCQESIATDLSVMPVEWGIGYTGVLHQSHKVFESYAWMHHVSGLMKKDELQPHDAVIPNCYDLDDFTPSDTHGSYLLYMGRAIERKGLAVVRDLAETAGVPVYVAGQTDPQIPNARYVGLVTGRAKAQLLAGAYAVLTPTTYLEPFGGVAVEAMLSGTPVIASDWGAFTETVQDGLTGFRCRTPEQYRAAVERVRDLDRSAIRWQAETRYSTTVGAERYNAYFAQLGLVPARQVTSMAGARG